MTQNVVATEHNVVNPVSTDANGDVVTDSFGTPATSSLVRESSDITKIDTNADGNKYIGIAPRGSATSASVWVITRIDSANPQTIDHSLPNQVYDDRTTVSYA